MTDWQRMDDPRDQIIEQYRIAQIAEYLDNFPPKVWYTEESEYCFHGWHPERKHVSVC